VTHPAEELVVRAVGDICLAGLDGDPFVHVAGELAADVVFGNLECCFASRGDEARKNVLFNADAALAPHLSRFDVLCLANNHVLDFGPDGLEDTLDVLDRHGLSYAGAGRNEREATAVRRFEAGGARVAVVSTVDASGGDAGRPTVSVLGVDAMAERVRAARPDVDVVIASYHGGIELEPLPSPFIVRSLRALVDAGADLVLAHHPHILQPAEVYNGRVIAYSLGNFVFDNRRYGEHAGVASTTAILDVRIPLGAGALRAATYTYVPVRIGEDFKPRLLRGDDAAAFHVHMRGLERGLELVDPGALDVRRLEDIAREVHTKSFETLVRYAVRHFRDFTFKEMVVGGAMVLKGMVRRRGGRRR
jgi:poly-gamma-glutamate synthesis protein (capsule biosynthesis protein)